ncbi:MAG: 4-(cytidine 5'-diphospho)-2-C-methyl-D-erythritol kinase [Pirellulales bacterium]
MLIESLEANRSIRFRCPAKLNLWLDTLGKRPDGYHEISTVMCPIDLWDELTVTVRDDELTRLTIHFPYQSDRDPISDPAWKVPADASNLVCKAVSLASKSIGKEAQGYDIQLVKRIPSSAGLGGGSSNAAAAVVSVLAVWGKWDLCLAGGICQKIGSDVNFFLGTSDGIGMGHATGRGEVVRLLKSKPAIQFWLTHPPKGCSTRDVYAKVDRIGDLSKTEDFLATCQTGQESKIGAAMFNALQLPASEINGWIHMQLELLAECGCKHLLMSGSGSSCFGIIPAEGSFELLRVRASEVGVNRVYQVSAWYGPSIERQLALHCR